MVAMYMNNRAVEALARRPARRRLLVGARGDRAVARIPRRVQHARRGVPQARRPRAGGSGPALRARARAREHAGDGQPGRASSPTPAARRSRRSSRRRSRKIEPEPPFAFFNRGMAAMRAGDLRAAKESFEREVARSPDYHEFHFWLAVAQRRTGRDRRGAQAPDHRDAEQHHAQRPRPLRGEARPAEERSVGRASARREVSE